MSIHLDDPLTAVPGIGRRLADRLADELGLDTVRALLLHVPRRYQDAGEVVDLDRVQVGRPATLIGEVRSWSTRRVPPSGRRSRPLDLATAEVRQASGARFTVTFFNQPWRPGRLGPGTWAAFSGEVRRYRTEVQLSAPEVHVLGRGGPTAPPDGAEDLDHQRFLPVYPATEALPSMRLAALIGTVLDALPEVADWLPAGWRVEHDLVDLDTALRDVHRPADRAVARRARDRLVFDELVTLQLGLQWRRAHLEADTVGLDHTPVPGGFAARFVAALPFPPTGAQLRALADIGADLGGAVPMHRLLQGDVGSGKTLVAVWTLLCAVDHGRQGALMAPTAVLAEQHHRTLTELLAPLGVNAPAGLRVELLTSATTAAARRRILDDLRQGAVDLIVGTHALLEEGVRFAGLGAVVIDEQHRFGVSQRVQLREKATPDAAAPQLPDVLVMTATPIPRSLALTLYGDLDVTVLDELPPGRRAVRTELIAPAAHPRRARLEAFVRAEVAAGRRVYVVCPYVTESDTRPGRAVVTEHARLATEVFPDLEVELVHGQLTPGAKERAMARFRSGEAPVLVATTVVEVGVDVPEASLMIIEDAERFGISQLHQLRGRVGRGSHASYCVLFTDLDPDPLDAGWRRLEAVAATTDGFALAERDLELRGTGQLFGTEQSGLPDLRLADLRTDGRLIARTRSVARQVVAADPTLSAPGHASLRAEVLRRYAGGLEAFAALQTG